MKKFTTFLTMALFCCVSIVAKDIKVLTVKTTPEMHCNGCETKIKNNVRFAAGVKKIDTNLEKKEVYVTYDADKTDAKKIAAEFEKIGYKTEVVSDKKAADKKVDAKTEASAQAK